MMSTFRFNCLIFCLLAFTFSNSIEAQNLFKSIEKAVNRSINKNAEKKVEESIDKAFEKETYENKSNKTNNEEYNIKTEEGDDITIDSEKISIKTKDGEEIIVEPNGDTEDDFVVASEFIGSFDIEINSEMKNSNKNEDIEIHYEFDKYKMVMEMKPEANQTMRTITDYQTKTMTTLIDEKGEKSGMKVKIPKITFKGEKESDLDLSKYKIVNTGETKTIDGYKCTKYTIEDDENFIESWLSKDVEIDLSIFATMVNSKQKKSGPQMGQQGFNSYGIEGFPLIVESTSKKKNEKTILKYKNIKVGTVDSKMFSTDGYQVQDMTQFSNMFMQSAPKN